MRQFRSALAAMTLAAACAMAACGKASPAAPLVQDAAIALPSTSGRIDHLAIDLARRRLFVAELGNGSVDVVDLATAKAMHRISGLDAPQGVAYAPGSDRLVVACSDGSVYFYDGDGYAPRGVLKLDDDADNAHLDPATGHVLIGHGSGGLAIVDPKAAAKLGDIALPAHPEGFAVSGRRVYINLPDASEIDVADLDAGKIVAQWKPLALSANFPLAVDDGGRVAVVFRGSARFALFEGKGGRLLAGLDTCRDADDVFFDAKRKRFLVSCGGSEVDVIAAEGTALREVGRVSTSWGARTSLFVPETGRLYVAERATLLGSDAAIAVFRPTEVAR
jgi:hypothetical protein